MHHAACGVEKLTPVPPLTAPNVDRTAVLDWGREGEGGGERA